MFDATQKCIQGWYSALIMPKTKPQKAKKNCQSNIFTTPLQSPPHPLPHYDGICNVIAIHLRLQSPWIHILYKDFSQLN